MPKKRKIFILLFLLPLFLCLSPGEEQNGEGSMAFLGQVVNSLILFGGLAYLLYKPLRSFLEKKASEIEQALREAESSRKAAEDQQQVLRDRLAGLSDEIKKLKAEAEAQGKREKERIAKLADDEGRKIRIQSRQEIEMQTQTGIRDLKSFLAERAISLARAKIQGTLATEDQIRLIDQSIERMSRVNEKSSVG